MYINRSPADLLGDNPEMQRDVAALPCAACSADSG